jgi:hypothetical protein
MRLAADVARAVLEARDARLAVERYAAEYEAAQCRLEESMEQLDVIRKLRCKFTVIAGAGPRS